MQTKHPINTNGQRSLKESPAGPNFKYTFFNEGLSQHQSDEKKPSLFIATLEIFTRFYKYVNDLLTNLREEYMTKNLRLQLKKYLKGKEKFLTQINCKMLIKHISILWELLNYRNSCKFLQRKNRKMKLNILKLKLNALTLPPLSIKPYSIPKLSPYMDSTSRATENLTNLFKSREQ